MSASRREIYDGLLKYLQDQRATASRELENLQASVSKIERLRTAIAEYDDLISTIDSRRKQDPASP
jgi:hypothetical protein